MQRHLEMRECKIYVSFACGIVWVMNTILFKIITRMKLLLSNYLGDYSYRFQGLSELSSITVTVSLFSSSMQLQEEFPLGILKNFLQFQLHDLPFHRANFIFSNYFR